ncbi:MAG: hypothetical protein HN981_02500 [Candidatus Pacebacteria bacterium]|nr:hypothetical protein [Candidatus Paceibacterota bacterium]MBT6921240.1 hypothetical protein [Candidatus Paceibacterota bacterium]
MKILPFPGRGKYESKNYILASLLITDPEFIEKIKKTRGLIVDNIKNDISDEIDEGGLLNLIFSLPSDKRKLLRVESEKIGTFLRFPANWTIPISTLILTNTLYFPEDSSPIKIHTPPAWLEIGEHRKTKKEDKMLLPWNEANNYVALYFTHDITIGRIRSWLENEENKAQLENLLSKLPKEPKSRLIEKRVFWGEIIWRMKNIYPNATWSFIEKKITSLISDEFMNLLNECNDEEKGFKELIEQIPTATELAKIYKSYEETKNNL